MIPAMTEEECSVCHEAVLPDDAVIREGKSYCPTCDAIITDGVEDDRRSTLRELFRPAVFLTPTPSDLLHDAMTEARAFPPDRINPHE